MGVIRSIKTATTRVLGNVSTALGVPRAVSAAILAVGATAIPVTGTLMFRQPAEVGFELWWVGDEDECRDYILEAQDGEGEVQIPEYTGPEKFLTGTMATREFTVETCERKVASGEYSAEVYGPTISLWRAKGSKRDPYGFDRIGDFYIGAVTPKLCPYPGNDEVNIGDLLTFYFDDGTSIGYLVGDHKATKVTDPNGAAMPDGVDPTVLVNYWGHIDGNECGVLEFWGDERIDSAMEPLRKSTGGSFRRVVSVTNNGTLSEWAKYANISGVVDGAELSKQNARNQKAQDAIDECKTKGNYDNSTLIAALVSYSFSQRHEPGDSNPGTKLYQTVCETVLGKNDDTASYHYYSCDRGVAAAVRWTGADIQFPAGDCSAQLKYCQQHAELWEPVNGAQGVVISGGDDWAESVGLQPGDIGMTEANGGHTLAYVGHQAIADGYDKFVKGTDGDIGEPTSTSAWVMASAGERPACMQDFSDDRMYYFFRYKGDYPDASEYADVGSMVSLPSTNKKGTSCDCIKCEDPNTDVGMDLAWLALSCVGTDGTTIAGINNDPWKRPSEYEPTKDNPGLLNEEKIYDVTLSANGGNHAYASCAQFVAAMAAAVVDLDISGHVDDPENSGSQYQVSAHPANMKKYMDHSPYFNKVNDGGNFSIDDCQPGDVFIFGTDGDVGHVCLFVGNELAQKRFPGTSGNVCEAGFNMTSLDCWYPKLSGYSSANGINVYRPVSHNKNSTYGEVDYRSIISWGQGPGKISTSCDDDEDDTPNQAYDGIIEAARTQLGLPYVFGAHHTMESNPPSLDCSGLVLWAYYHGAQIDIEGSGGINQGNSRTSGGMYDVAASGSGPWEIVDVSRAVAGDVVCWPGTGTGHVALYIDGTMDSLHVIHETYWECKEETINSGYCYGLPCYILHWKG